MDEKVSSLMEETGCTQSEAEQALNLSQNDFHRAIMNIRTEFRNIVVIKGKLIMTTQNLYGIFIIILNKRSEDTRIRTVISYNPAIYEINLAADWEMVEKLIYTYRLQEGSLLSLSQDIEKHFYNRITGDKNSFISFINNDKKDKIIESLMIPSEPAAEMNIVIDELNLSQYQQGFTMRKIPQRARDESSASNKVFLEVKLQEDDEGKKVRDLNTGDVVLAQIIDTRDIAKYLSKLLGMKDEEYLPVAVENIESTGTARNLKLFFSTGITGTCKIELDKRIKVTKEIQVSWLKKLFRLK
jgi:hypothetical protein